MIVKYYYTISYDEIKDDFYGTVERRIGSRMEDVYIIESTKDILDLLKTGVMDHIDDVDGLKSFLVNQELLTNHDELILMKEVLY